MTQWRPKKDTRIKKKEINKSERKFNNASRWLGKSRIGWKRDYKAPSLFLFLSFFLSFRAGRMEIWIISRDRAYNGWLFIGVIIRQVCWFNWFKGLRPGSSGISHLRCSTRIQKSFLSYFYNISMLDALGSLVIQQQNSFPFDPPAFNPQRIPRFTNFIHFIKFIGSHFQLNGAHSIHIKKLILKLSYSLIWFIFDDFELNYTHSVHKNWC